MPYPQVLRHCTPVRKDTQTKNIPAPAHALFSYVFFSLRSDTTVPARQRQKVFQSSTAGMSRSPKTADFCKTALSRHTPEEAE